MPRLQMKTRQTVIERLVSGGQTGADRAALDFAFAHHLPHGGWCPKGRLAEDGPIPVRYHLQETPDADYAQRTEWNVRDSDGTVVFSIAPVLAGGSLATAEFARRLGRPCLHLPRTAGTEAELAQRLAGFLRRHRIKVLNVAGPRASGEPGVGALVKGVLTRLMANG